MRKTLLITVLMALVGMTMAQNHWTPMTGNQYNMTVKGVISIDGVVQNVTTLEIGAFCGEECRASTFPQFFPPTQEYVATVTIRSNALSGETITFRLFDHVTQQELDLDCENTVEFVNDGSIGTIGNWFQFSFVTQVIHNITSGDWNDPNTWGGTLPGDDAIVELIDDVTIGENSTVAVADLTITDGVQLVIESGSTLIVTGDLVNGDENGLVIADGAQVINTSSDVKATVEKDISAYTAKGGDGWYTIASPVDNMAIAGSDFLTPEYDLYRYNETIIGEEWENYKYSGNTGFTTFENGRGYLYANNNSFSPVFTGTLNNTDVTYGLTYTDRPDGLSGFNLIGNPFPHAIYKGNGGAIDDNNLASGYYTLDNESTWHTHTYEDAIMPGQGVLIKTTLSKNLTIAKSNAVATAETSSAKVAAGRLDIKVAGNTGEDRAFVYFSHGIGLEKMSSLSDQVPNLWIQEQDNNYAITHVDNNYESLDICFSNKLDADFTISFATRDTNFSYLKLVDNITGSITDLLQQPDYAFHATGNEVYSRFRLVFKVATGVEETEDEAPFAYVNNGKIILIGVNEEADLQVFDMTGRTVSAKSLKPGVYVLRLMNGNMVRTQKMVIK